MKYAAVVPTKARRSTGDDEDEGGMEASNR
jgi:hypothetical protein